MTWAQWLTAPETSRSNTHTTETVPFTLSVPLLVVSRDRDAVRTWVNGRVLPQLRMTLAEIGQPEINSMSVEAARLLPKVLATLGATVMGGSYHGPTGQSQQFFVANGLPATFRSRSATKLWLNTAGFLEKQFAAGAVLNGSASGGIPMRPIGSDYALHPYANNLTSMQFF